VRKVLEDGTRVYSNYTRYTPVAEGERKYGRNKPDDPDAVRWYGTWLLPLELLAHEERVMPETRPDTDAYVHMSYRGWRCRCDVCKRPEADRWKEQYWADLNPRGRDLRLTRAVVTGQPLKALKEKSNGLEVLTEYALEDERGGSAVEDVLTVGVDGLDGAEPLMPEPEQTGVE
jgi:hypothetical protein